MATTHPAVFSLAIIEELATLVDRYDLTEKLVIDPFAGEGNRIDVLPVDVVKVELQWSWAARADKGMVNGNARHLPFRDNVFFGVISSPAYGNRMADRHNAQERCSKCFPRRHGRITSPGTQATDTEPTQPPTPNPDCQACGGTGRRAYKRITYKHILENQFGEALHPDNTGGAQWTQPAYRTLHEEAWAETTRVCKPGAIFLLNVSDHIRDKQKMNVSQWHMMTLHRMGWRMLEFGRVVTPRLRYGANHEARLYYENVFVMKKER